MAKSFEKNPSPFLLALPFPKAETVCELFELLVTKTPKTTAPRRVDFQISFAGSRNMACHGESVPDGGEVCRLEVAGDGEVVALCECRTVDPAQKAHLTFETAMAEQLMVPDDSDDDDDE